MNSLGHEDEAEPDGLDQYSVVANRRQQWDVLLWHMPTMALTGEAFLLTIALAGSTLKAGRILASALAMIVALAALHSLSAHRLSELTDAAWLLEHGKGTRRLCRSHGLTWRDRRIAIVKDHWARGRSRTGWSHERTRSAPSSCASGTMAPDRADRDRPPRSSRQSDPALLHT